jgi:alpha-tubulin suppressor-like RCC1 family protein
MVQFMHGMLLIVFVTKITNKYCNRGANTNGQLSDGTTTSPKATPVKSIVPAGLTKAVALYSGMMSNTVFAVSNESVTYAFGDDSNYNMGLGTSHTVVSSPLVVPNRYTGSQYSSMSTSDVHTLYVISSVTCFAVFADDPNVCTAHGTCVDFDVCQCREGFVDQDCSIPVCFGRNASDTTVCSGHGMCMTNNTCICYDGYTGSECQIEKLGYLYGSGDNSYGQIADGNKGLVYYSPVVAESFRLQNVRIASGANSFSFIITANNTLYSVGYNANGQLGLGSTASVSIPTKVSGLNSTIVSVCGGLEHAAAVDNQGRLFTWGLNSHGELADGTTVSKTTPVQITSLANEFIVSVSCGYYHTVALTRNSTVWSWGYNGYGQLGDGSTTNRLQPFQVYLAGLLYKKRAAKVVAGGYLTMVLAGDGQIYSFGYNGYGQMGDGTSASKYVPTSVTGPIATKKVISIATSGHSSYAVTSEGVVYSCGYSGQGQTGISTATLLTLTPITTGLLASEQVVEITSGMSQPSYIYSHVLALTANNTVFGWGYAASGQFADGTTTSRTQPGRFNSVYPMRSAVAISAGMSHSLVIYNSNITCFGVFPDDVTVCNRKGQCTAVDTCLCEDGYSGPECNVFDCFNITTSDSSVCSGHGRCIAEDVCLCDSKYTGDECEREIFGLAFAAGQQNYLNLGDATGQDSIVPSMVVGHLQRRFVNFVDAGYEISVSLSRDQTVYTFGRGTYGAMGFAGAATTQPRPYPTITPATYNITKVCAHQSHMVALTDKGQVISWGYNGNGQMGDSTTNNRATPYLVPNIPENIVSIACGRSGTFAIAESGALYSWGISSSGETGTGSLSNVYVPTRVVVTLKYEKIVQVSSGMYHVLALTNKGSVFSWGSNSFGSLGDATVVSKTTPVPVLGELTTKVVVAVAAGYYNSYALTQQGEVYAWGISDYGQLAQGDTTNKLVPTKVKGLDGIKIISITVGGDVGFMIAVASNGTAYSIGYNGYGQLADGTRANKNKFVQVVNPSSNRFIVAASTGSGHTLFIINGTFCYGVFNDDPLSCSNHGNCTGTDTCECETGYSGPECSITTCFGYNNSDSNTCSGNGDCVSYNVCSCSLGFTGTQCEIPVYGIPAHFGRNNQGQLGDLLTIYNQVMPGPPASPLAYNKIAHQIAAGGEFSVVVTRDQELYLYGLNNNGQFGDGSTASKVRPTLVTPGTGKIIASCAHNTLSVVVDSSGAVYTSGYYSGNMYYYAYVKVVGIPEPAVYVSCGSTFAIALTQTGKVYSWGVNDVQQLGDQSVSYSTTAVRVGADPLKGGWLDGTATMSPRRIVAIATGDQHALLLSNMGEVFAFGRGSEGQLGDGAVINRWFMRQVTGVIFKKNIVKVYAGQYSSYAVSVEGDVYSWGYGNSYVLGTGTQTNQLVPVQITSLKNITSLSASKAGAFVLAVSTNGTVYGWGINSYSNLGDLSTVTRTVPTVAYNPFPQRFVVDVAAGTFHSMYMYNGTYCFDILSDDTSVCSFRGKCVAHDTCQCEDGYIGNDCSIPTCFGYNTTDVSACSGHGTCAAKDVCLCSSGYAGDNCEKVFKGLLYTYGRNNLGQLGDDYYDDTKLPSISSYPLNYNKYILSIQSSDSVSFAITTNYEMYVWGQNSFYTLGFGDTASLNVPKRLTFGTGNVISACTNTFHSAGIDTSGTVYTWGFNTVSQATSCYNGNYWPYTYYCSQTGNCGNNYCSVQKTGQLGNPSYYWSVLPIPVQGLPTNEKYIQVVCGLYHTMVLAKSGKVYSFGQNNEYQLGVGSGPSYALSAMQVNLDDVYTLMPDGTRTVTKKKVVSIAAGDYFSTAITDRAEYLAWGANTNGQLSDNTALRKWYPVQIAHSIHKQPIVWMEPGRASSYVVTSNGAVYAGGLNSGYQLGLGTTTQQNLLVKNPTLSNVTTLMASSGGPDFVLAFSTNNRTLYGWGNNGYYMLGDNTATLRTVPTPSASQYSSRYVIALAGGSSHTMILYNGTYCSHVLADDPSVCSFRGTCVDSDVCICNTGYTGINCEYALCNNITNEDPDIVCSGHGRCLYNETCMCDPGYEGIYCDSQRNQFLFASGDDTYSQLGDGFFTNQNTPRQSSIFSRTRFQFMSAGDGYSFAVSSGANSATYAWGINNYGILADGTTTPRYYPTKVFAGITLKRMVTCSQHALAIDSNNQLYAWGRNQVGQIGSGDNVDSYVPKLVKNLESEYIIDMACGDAFSIAVTEEGIVYTWGAGSSGQLGNGQTANSNVPVKVQGVLNLKKIILVAAGSTHALALSDDSVLFSWGSSSNGQLGDAKTITRTLPFIVKTLYGKQIASIDATLQTSFALLTNSEIWNFGQNNVGQIGDNTVVDKNVPVKVAVPSTYPVISMDAGNSYFMALMSNGSAFATGQNTKGQLSDSSFTNKKVLTSVYGVVSQRYITAVSAGSTHTLFLYDGLSCFGVLFDDPSVCSWHGTCNATDVCDCQPGYSGEDCSIATCYGLLGTDPDVCSGNGFCIAVDTCVCSQGNSGRNCDNSNVGFLFGSGENDKGQQADRNIGIQPIASVSGLFQGKKINFAVPAFKYSFVREASSGVMYAVGSNQYGQIGDSTNVTHALPVPVYKNVYNIVGMCGGFQHSLACDGNGTVWAAGTNKYGQLGIGSGVAYSYTPVPVTGLLANKRAIAVSCGYYHSMVLTDEFEVYTFGYNLDGELGDNSQTNRFTPVKVGALLDGKKIVQIDAGAYHSLALGSDGAMYAWGLNTFGQLGDSTTVNKILPVQVAGIIFGKVMKQIGAGTYFSVALGSDTTSIYSFGRNTNAQLLDGTVADKTSPVLATKFPAGYNITSISVGGDYVTALTENGTVLSYGSNWYGQLASNQFNVTATSIPVKASMLPYTAPVTTFVASGETFNLYLVKGTSCYGKLQEDPLVCSSKGICIAEDHCLCDPLYNAPDCSSYMCFDYAATDPAACNRHGVCVAADACICRPGWTGINCETPVSGYVYSVGAGTKYQLGDGYTFTQTDPVAAAGKLSGTAVSSIASGTEFTLVVTVDGRLFSFGVNDVGQLGIGNKITQSLPVQVTALASKHIIHACAGQSHSVAVDSDGFVYTFGSNYYAQLGNNDPTFTDSAVPVLVSGGAMSGMKIVSVTCGTSHTIALAENGMAFGWGNGVDGQLGAGSNDIQKVPVQVGVGVLDNIPLALVIAGYKHNIAVGPFGVLYAWGSNSYSQLADSTTFTRYSPVPVTSGALKGKIAIHIGASEENTFVVTLDKSVISVGGGFYGTLGDGTTNSQYKSTPLYVGNSNTTFHNPRLVYGGRNFAYVLDLAKNASSWGSDLYSQLGYGSTATTRSLPVPVSNKYKDRAIISIAPGATHTAFIYNATACYGFLSDDPNVCSGRGVCVGPDNCQCRNGFSAGDCSHTVCNGRTSNDPNVCSGRGSCLPQNTCVCYPSYTGIDCQTTQYGFMFGSGQNQLAQIGDGSTVDSKVWRKSSAAGFDRIPLKYISAGLSFSFGISTTNQILAAGLNDQGQLGDSTTNNAKAPVRPLLPSNTAFVVTGYSYAIAVLDNGTALSFGSNAYGQLGLGVIGGQRTIPTKISGLENVTKVSCALSHCLVVTTQGDAYAFGANEHAQLGDGTSDSGRSQYAPIQLLGIFAIKRVVSVFAAAYHSLALTNDGTVYAWGDNTRGSCGLNYTSTQLVLVPKPVIGLENQIVVDITGGEYFSCALTKSGQVFCWGACESGQCGQADTSDKIVPVRVGGALLSQTVVKISGGSSGFMLAKTSSSQLYGWGVNNNGQLSDNSTVTRFQPVLITSYASRTADLMTAGRFHSLGLFTGQSCFNVLSDDYQSVCSGNGTCYNVDRCKCNAGFSGINCEFTSCSGLNQTASNVCSGHGDCKYLNQCFCHQGNWMGQQCEYDACFGMASNDPAVCSRNGACIAPGNCSCAHGYVGNECQLTMCHGRNSSDPKVCSGKGFCYSPDVCLCFTGYTGGNCSYPICKSRFIDRTYGIESIQQLPAATSDLIIDTSNVCSGHGSCDLPNKCTCTTGYADQYCSTPICNGKNATDPSVCNYGRNGTCISYNNCTCLTYFEDNVCKPLVCFGKNSTTVPAACNADSQRGNCFNVDKCVCREGFGGLECEQNVCNNVLEYNRTFVCNGRGTCDTPDQCTCKPGYSGDDCEFIHCYGKTNADEDVCSGHGDCAAPENCQCSEGYAGEKCQLTKCYDKLSNQTDICQGHGKCITPENCECVYGYSGYDCFYPSCFEMNTTDVSVCSGHGDCYKPDKCRCTDGYVSRDCSIPTCDGIWSTDKTVCSGSGFCVAPEHCECFVGRVGSNCELNVCFGYNETEPEVCSTHGVCTGPSRCKCDDGYTSMDCSVPICYNKPAYVPTVCSMEGECIAPDVCECREGRTGEQCQYNVCFSFNQTDPDVCSGHGSCAHTDTCNCKSGYTGEECEYPICYSVSAESNAVCSGHGECVDPNQCNCSSGYMGNKCEQTKCFGKANGDAMVCNGRGTCSYATGLCACQDGYSGGNCEVLRSCNGMNFTNEDSCSGNGLCVGQNLCRCNTGYTGRDCEYPVCYSVSADAEGIVCSGRGFCESPDMCFCNDGYTGDKCELTVCFGKTNKDSEVCNGRGQCSGTPNKCTCNSGYFGSNCEYNGCFGRNATDPLVCSGHGNCTGMDACSCTTGYSGSQCQHPVCFGASIASNSTSTICTGHGSCVAPDHCDCNTGYVGESCDTPICNSLLASDANVCRKRGICTSPNHCVCKDGWSGNDCEALVQVCSEKYMTAVRTLETTKEIVMIDTSCSKIVFNVEISIHAEIVFNHYSGTFIILMNGGVYEFNPVTRIMIFIREYHISGSVTIRIDGINQITVISVTNNIYIEQININVNVTITPPSPPQTNTNYTVIIGATGPRYTTYDIDGNVYVLVVNNIGLTCIVRIDVTGIYTVIATFENFPSIIDVQSLIYINGNVYIVVNNQIYMVQGNTLISINILIRGITITDKIETDTLVYLIDMNMEIIIVIDKIKSVTNLYITYMSYPTELIVNNYILISIWNPTVKVISPVSISLHNHNTYIELYGQYLKFSEQSTIILYNPTYNLVFESPLIDCRLVGRNGSVCFRPNVTLPSTIGYAEFTLKLNIIGGNVTNLDLSIIEGKTFIVYQTEITLITPTEAIVGRTITIQAPYITSNVMCAFGIVQEDESQLPLTRRLPPTGGESGGLTIVPPELEPEEPEEPEAPSTDEPETTKPTTNVVCRVPTMDGLYEGAQVTITIIVDGENFGPNIYFYYNDPTRYVFYDSMDVYITFINNFYFGWNVILAPQITWINFHKEYSRSLIQFTSIFEYIQSQIYRRVIVTKEHVITSVGQSANVEFILEPGIGYLVELFINVPSTGSSIIGSLHNSTSGETTINIILNVNTISVTNVISAPCKFESHQPYTMTLVNIKAEDNSYSIRVDLMLSRQIVCSAILIPDMTTRNYTQAINHNSTIIIGQSLSDSDASQVVTPSQNYTNTVYIDRVWIGCNFTMCNQTFDFTGPTIVTNVTNVSVVDGKYKKITIHLAWALGLAVLLCVLCIFCIFLAAALAFCCARRRKKKEEKEVAQKKYEQEIELN